METPEQQLKYLEMCYYTSLGFNFLLLCYYFSEKDNK